MGDSIGEGVQSGDASNLTQPSTYLNWVAIKMGVPFALPLIQSGPFGMAGDTSNRSRISPSVLAANLSVSGADVSSILDDRADAASEDEIDSETDLVLFPRLGSQMEIAEALNPPLIICWIGNNDILGAATSFDQLDATQMTSVVEFSERFEELVERLGNLDGGVVLANIPDVTSIAFLMDAQDLTRLLGTDLGLPDGDFTTLATVFLVKLGLADGSIIQDPSFVLDSGEVQQIRERTQVFNQIIAQAAASIGAPVLDANGIFQNLTANPPVIMGIPLTRRFQGGLFSLDGVHPSNIGHIVVAHFMLQVINGFFGTSFPEMTPNEFATAFFNEPFLDKDRDGVVVGRPFSGLLETVAFVAGFTGDADDWNAGVSSSQRDAEGQRMQNTEDMRAQIDRDQLIRAFRTIWHPNSQ
jgi:hypothetical protein